MDAIIERLKTLIQWTENFNWLEYIKFIEVLDNEIRPWIEKNFKNPEHLEDAQKILDGIDDILVNNKMKEPIDLQFEFGRLITLIRLDDKWYKMVSGKGQAGGKKRRSKTSRRRRRSSKRKSRRRSSKKKSRRRSRH